MCVCGGGGGGGGGEGGGGCGARGGNGVLAICRYFLFGGGSLSKLTIFFLGLTKFSVFLGGIVRIVVGTFC